MNRIESVFCGIYYPKLVTATHALIIKLCTVSCKRHSALSSMTIAPVLLANHTPALLILLVMRTQPVGKSHRDHLVRALFCSGIGHSQE